MLNATAVRGSLFTVAHLSILSITARAGGVEEEEEWREERLKDRGVQSGGMMS